MVSVTVTLPAADHGKMPPAGHVMQTSSSTELHAVSSQLSLQSIQEQEVCFPCFVLIVYQCLFVHSFIQSFINSLPHLLTHSRKCLLIHSFTHPAIHWSVHLFICPFVHHWSLPFCSSIYSFFHSFVHSFILSVIHSRPMCTSTLRPYNVCFYFSWGSS